MTQPIVQAAMNEIWSTPDIADQFILKPGRITPDGGVIGSYSVLWDNYTMPNSTSNFHLYQIGQIHPLLMALFTPTTDQWELLSDAANQAQLITDLYTASGIEIPRCRTWYIFTQKSTVLLAVEANVRLNYDFDQDALYLRTYRNPYFQRSDLPAGAQIKVNGLLTTSLADISSLQSEITTIQQSSGYTGGLYYFINGIKVSDISAGTANVGDVCEYVYDPSIYKVVDFKISTLPSFLSTLDSKTKYLLHYPIPGDGQAAWDGFIDFIDNIDMFIIDSSSQTGYFVNKNNADTLRMVTFKDYSVVCDYLSAYYNNFIDGNGNLNVSNLYLRLHVRYDGNDQMPTEEANRLHYLLKLDDTHQTNAMVGLDANIAPWNAANLEKSAYVQLMRATYSQVTLPLSEQAYGYSVVNSKFSLNFQVPSTVNSVLVASVPLAMQASCTAYEYDSTGVLLGFYVATPHIQTYICSNANAVLVEFISGKGGDVLDETYGEITTALTVGNNYRWYMRQIVNGVLQPTWSDVTGNTTQYSISNNIASWNASGNKYRIVRSDKNFLTYNVQLNPSDGVLRHTLSYSQNGGTVTLPVPLGELDLWLNGHALVPGIDYLYSFPNVTIFSKAYLISAPGVQTLTVRMTGFCKSDLSQQKVEEIGFVWNGVLGVDAPYGMHYAKSNRIVVGGLVQNPSTVTFLEDADSGSFTNGAPYAVREMINPLNSLIDVDPYTYYATDVATDQVVGAYMQLKDPPTVQGPLNPITTRYELYSPFICKIIYALVNGNITAAQISGQYPDSVVQSLCSPYTYLLALDPIQVGNTPDQRYTVIEPHWLTTSITLTPDQYRFLSSVVRIYANGLVTLSELVSVSS